MEEWEEWDNKKGRKEEERKKMNEEMKGNDRMKESGGWGNERNKIREGNCSWRERKWSLFCSSNDFFKKLWWYGDDKEWF